MSDVLFACIKGMDSLHRIDYRSTYGRLCLVVSFVVEIEVPRQEPYLSIHLVTLVIKNIIKIDAYDLITATSK